MGIINSRGLGELDGTTPLTSKLISLSLGQALERYNRFRNKQVYYVGASRRGTRLFGIIGNSNLVSISEEIYEAIGMPNEGRVLSADYILEKAGYKF